MMVKHMMKPTLITMLVLCLMVGCGPEPRRTTTDFAPTEASLSPDERDPVMARVNGTMIRRSDVEREALAQSEASNAAIPEPGDAAFIELLDQLIDQRLLALEARRRGLHQSDEARRRMALAEERILGNVLVETALADAVTEETIRRIYDEQVQLLTLGEEVRARHILVDARDEADALKTLLDNGENFADLAVRVSQDHATRLEGGDLGYFSREGILPAFGAVAFSTGEGQISDPFQTEFGWHILTVVDRRRQPPPSLESMRANIVRFYTFDQLEGLVAGLRSEAMITRPELSLPAGPDELDQTLDDAVPSDDAPE
jgi:peptidyl-prolyl cis-trans isomerase C